MVSRLCRTRAGPTDAHLQQLSATFVAAADQCGRRNAALWLAVAEAPRIVPSPVPMRRSGTPLGANLGTAEGAHGPNSRVEQAGRPAVDLLAVPLPRRRVLSSSIATTRQLRRRDDGRAEAATQSCRIGSIHPLSRVPLSTLSDALGAAGLPTAHRERSVQGHAHKRGRGARRRARHCSGAPVPRCWPWW